MSQYAKATAFGGSSSGGTSPVTTEGDLIVGNASGAEARLPIGASGLVLKSNGTTATWSSVGGTGDVVGPASATDNAIARYDTTTGKLLQNSSATIDDSGNISANNLSGINTGDMSNAQVKAAYEANSNTNAFTDSDVINLSNQSGINTGDQTSVSGKSGNTDALNSATTTIDVSAATAPSSGQVLTATSSTTATWQTPSSGGGSSLSIETKIANFTAAAGKTYLVSSAAARTITLPTAAINIEFWIKDSTGDANTNNFTIARTSTESIEGIAADKILQTDWGSWHFICDGTDWFIL